MKLSHALLLLSATLTAPATVMAQEINFEFINNTNETVTGLYLFPLDRDEAENLLEGSSMVPGEAADVDLGEAAEGCIHTALIDFANGQSNQQDDLDLCTMQRLYAIASIPQEDPAVAFQSAESQAGCETEHLAGSCDWNAELAKAGQAFNQNSGSLSPDKANRVLSLLSEAFERGTGNDIGGACGLIEQVNSLLACP